MSDQTPPEGTEQVPATATVAEETVQTPAIAPEPPVADPVAPEVPQVPDYKDKFQHSASEALILHAQNKQKDELINKLTSQDAPSEAEINAEYPTFAQMDAPSQKFVLDLM